jgi:nucleoside-diphosphate-sugar epimerase
MGHRIFLAGAAGAIGSRLVPLLHRAGHHVTGTTRSPEKVDRVSALGAEPMVVDVFDAEALTRAVAFARPDIVVHQLTDLPPGLDPARMAAAVAPNARIREEGTANLIRAARAAGAQRFIAQSIAWMFAPGKEPYGEDDPLDHATTDAARATTLRGVVALEDQVLNAPPLRGIVLRYGQLYGPGTGADSAQGSAPVHVDAAAYAASLAIERGTHGIFNVSEPSPYLATEKIRRELGWRDDFRLRS